MVYDERLKQYTREYYKKNKEKISARNKKYYERTREKWVRQKRQYREKNREESSAHEREAHLIRRYGITKSEYDRMLETQDYKCKICEASEPGKKGAFPVDHCHATDRVRGLLCHKCNTVLGKMGDSPELLRKAAKYLEDSEENET